MAAAAPYTDPNDPLGSPDSTQDPAEAAYRRALLAQVAGPPPSSIANQSPATMRQTLDARAKALAATNDDLARMYKGIAIEQQHQRDAPWSFDAARTLKLQQDEQTYETMRQQHLGELKQQ